MAPEPGPLVPPEMVSDQLDWDLSVREQGILTAKIAEGSDLARFYGTVKWVDESTCPPAVQRIIAAAVTRYMRNPDGFDESKAADETVRWPDRPDLGYVSFDAVEIARIQKAASPSVAPSPDFGSFGTVAWGTKRSDDTCWVEGRYANGSYASPFPLFVHQCGEDCACE